MKTKQLALILTIGLLVISCANDYEFMEDYQSQDWETTLGQIVSENMTLYSNSDIFLKGYEETDIYSLSGYSFINPESRYPVMTGNKITLAPYEFIRFDTLMCHVKSSHIDNLVKNSLNHKDELVAVELQWVVKDALMNTIALFDKKSGELVYDNILYNTITMDAVKMNRLRKHKLTRSENWGYSNGDFQGGFTSPGSDSYTYSLGNEWVATIYVNWVECGHWELEITPIDSLILRFDYKYKHDYTTFTLSDTINPNKPNYQVQKMAMAVAPTGNNYKILYLFYVGTNVQEITFNEEFVGPIIPDSGDGGGYLKLYTESPQRSSDYVYRDQFNWIQHPW